MNLTIKILGYYYKMVWVRTSTALLEFFPFDFIFIAVKDITHIKVYSLFSHYKYTGIK